MANVLKSLWVLEPKIRLWQRFNHVSGNKHENGLIQRKEPVERKKNTQPTKNTYRATPDQGENQKVTKSQAIMGDFLGNRNLQIKSTSCPRG